MTARVSVCVPSHNDGRFLRESLSSILAQTYTDIEVVVVDDASTDDTAGIVGSFDDPRIRYVRNEQNLGGYQTMNVALGLARGELVAVYHSDDVYEAKIVEKEVAYLSAHPDAGAVFSLDRYIDDEGRVFGETTMPAGLAGRETLGYDDLFPYMLRHKNTLLRCPTFMTRRRTLEAVGLFDAERYDIAADVDMWIRILRRFPVGVLEEPLLRYRVGASQWSAQYARLRTEPELFFAIMDRYLTEDGWTGRLEPQDMVEYRFHRLDDETTRAANFVIQGEREAARALLGAGSFPWRTLASPGRRRKARVLLLRVLLRAGLAAGVVWPLRLLLARTEYGGRP